MNLLIIEDQPDFIELMRGACKKYGVSLTTPTDVRLDDGFSDQEEIEAQLEKRLRLVVENQKIDLGLLDSDLSRLPGLRTQTEFRQAFQRIGVPVCRYRKRQTVTPLALLAFMHRLASDGASAVMVPGELAQSDEASADNLVIWLKQISEGFREIERELEKHKAILDSSPGPAGVLAHILGLPSLATDLLGYTAQNFYFFGPAATSEKTEASRKKFSTQLGYWLFNYILAFPGPLLNRPSAAAYLNITAKDIERGDVEKAIAAAQYKGPFGGTGPFYWRERLDDLLEGARGDIALVKGIAGEELARVAEGPMGLAYYCLLSREPIKAEDAASNPDWIPSGAQLARIKQEDLDQLGPMLNI